MKFLQLAVDDRNRELPMDSRVMLLWLALFIADSFVLHKVVQRNVVACILGYLYLLAFKVLVLKDFSSIFVNNIAEFIYQISSGVDLSSKHIEEVTILILLWNDIAIRIFL